ncbi:DUF3037 domain-containing protein [Catenovulum sediminis]|uniref:DUF3037 domain-containing protein n=1 Tax=Catenovulum sediminis TaxID=1740262 RepID=A0ABV1RMT3_9ALTE
MSELNNTNTQCMYVVVRFMPFAETREFANVGVVVIAPKLGLYEFKLAPKSFKMGKPRWCYLSPCD